MTRVVLVRPWTDVRGGAGCCGGDARDGICFDTRVDGHPHDEGASLVGEVFRRLRAEHPGLDVQIVSASNTAYLLPSTFRAVRARSGVLAAARAAARATTAGAVLVDGERVGDVETLGVHGTVRAVRAAVGRVGTGA